MSEQEHGGILRLYKMKRTWECAYIQQNYSTHPLYYPKPIVCASVLDHACVAMAWVTCTQIELEIFAYTIYAAWLEDLLNGAYESPQQLHQEEFFYHKPDDSFPSLRDIACDIDRIDIDRECVYVRDVRLLPDNATRPYPANWRQLRRPTFS